MVLKKKENPKSKVCDTHTHTHTHTHTYIYYNAEENTLFLILMEQ